MPLPLTGIKVCVFDAYGTLLDYASAAAGCREALGEKFAALTTLWREKQLQYTWLRTLEQRHADFWQVTADALDFSLETLEISDRALRDRLLDLYLRLEPFPEVHDVLRALRAAGFKTAILSNGTSTMLAAAVAHAKLDGLLDAVLSIDAVGVYKPHSDVYRLATDRFGVTPAAVAFQSANAWDAWGAAAFGLRVVWCNRYAQRAERLPGAPDRVVASLAELPALLGSCQGGSPEAPP
jgi:2-haloacid dehalogenase